MQEYPNRFKEFFTNPRNSVRRESLLLNRLSYDLQLASAIAGYYLKTYISDVDDNGYDVILDTEMRTRKLQVKSFLNTSKTSSWKISKGLIKPDMNEQRTVPFWGNIHPPGIGGGIILQKVFLSEKDIELEYFYTDIHIITLMSLGIIGSKRQEKLARGLIGKLLDGDYHDKISVTKLLFVQPKSTEHLLSLMDLHSRYSTTNWRYYLISRHKREGTREYLGPKEYLDEKIIKEFADLCI